MATPINTTNDIDAAREFTGSMREMVDLAAALLADGSIESYSFNSNSKRVRVMGVRLPGGAWGYLAPEAPLQFDAARKPHRDGLPATIVEKMNAVFYARRTAGLNVQFVRSTDGQIDEWSFANAEQRDSFVASLIRQNIRFAISH
ncbi:hypothetical protein NKI96_10610 [Mesorhizobium sp. M0292]|uniref:hypothetical protein n=1 Tax=Mesorhizobium sp. M0292 TaxID=2956929 RepID=UPI00333AC0FC